MFLPLLDATVFAGAIRLADVNISDYIAKWLFDDINKIQNEREKKKVEDAIYLLNMNVKLIFYDPICPSNLYIIIYFASRRNESIWLNDIKRCN